MSETNAQGLKIMVIDDALTITRAAELYLAGGKEKTTGYNVRTVSEGFDAIPEIFSFLPDIIFLDVMMQKVDGYTICGAIKNHPQLRQTTVIMLTSKDGLFDRARGKDAGADDYITKPFTRDGILKVVQHHADLRRAAQAGRAAQAV